MADVVSKKASTASAGGGIAGAAVGTLALQFLPKLYDPAKKQFKKAKDWSRVYNFFDLFTLKVPFLLPRVKIFQLSTLPPGY